MHIFQLIDIKTTERAYIKEGWYIFDEQGNAYLAEYVKHTIKQQGDKTFYKMYFKTKSEALETVIY